MANNSIPMGIGKLGQPGLIFVRQFRFTVSADHLSHDFNYSVDIDWFNHSLTITAYEVFVNNEVPIVTWATDLESEKYPNETILLTVYDGCGSELYKWQFSDLTVTGRTSAFDYSSSGVTMHKVTLSFGESDKLEATTKVVYPTEPTPVEVHHLNEKATILN